MEKSDEQIAKDKAAIDAMKNARANMDAALRRVSSLESALTAARDAMATIKSYVPKQSYLYKSERSAHDMIDGYIADAIRALG